MESMDFFKNIISLCVILSFAELLSERGKSYTQNYTLPNAIYKMLHKEFPYDSDIVLN